jgi:hypothetical protein
MNPAVIVVLDADRGRGLKLHRSDEHQLEVASSSMQIGDAG